MKKIHVYAAATLALALPAILAGNEVEAAHAIHSDCVHSENPTLCSILVEQLASEVGAMYETFATGDMNETGTFISSSSAVIKVFDTYYLSGDTYVNDFLIPLYEDTVASMGHDFSGLHYQMISQDLFITYGVVTRFMVLKDGSTYTAQSRAMSTWRRRPGGAEKRFEVVAYFDEPFAEEPIEGN
jgi:hypothetical protein